MTPLEIELAARRKYNAVNDSFWSSEEIANLIYAACLELSAEGVPIERVHSTTSVADQQQYDYPENTLLIKRITYNGKKLNPIDMREDDALTLSNSTTTATGTPQYYFVWNETFYLRPVPASAGDTIKVFSSLESQPITPTSVLEIPTIFHMRIVDYVTSEMAAKDQNFNMATFYADRWDKHKLFAKKWAMRRKRGDSFATVKDEESLPVTILGTV